MNTLTLAAPQGLELFFEHPGVMGASCLFQVFIFGMTIWAIVHYSMRLRYSLKTRRLAAIFLAASLSAQLYALIMLFGSPLLQSPSLSGQSPEMRPFLMVGIVLGVGVVMLLTTVQGLAATAAGTYFSTRLRQPHFPYLRSLFRAARRSLPRRRSFPWLLTLALAAAFIAYSALLLWLVPSQISTVAKKSAQGLEALVLTTESVFVLALLVSLIAVTEEIIFRLFLQTQFEYWFRKSTHAATIAILITSVIWTMGHAASLDPVWVKFAQTLPIGLALGWLRRRHGVESCILVHVLFNIGAVYLLQSFVQT